MDSDKLTLAYAGTLIGFEPLKKESDWWKVIKDYLWEYKPETCFPYTRSGFFLFKAVSEFKNRYPSLANEIQINIWGDIKPLNQEQVEKFGLSDIINISGVISKQETLAKLQETDVLFLPLESNWKGQSPLFTPGKLFEYIAIRKPILGLMEESDAKEILIKSNLGKVVSPFNTDEIADTLRWFIENKKNLQEYFVPNEEYISSFSFNEAARKIDHLFINLLNQE